MLPLWYRGRDGRGIGSPPNETVVGEFDNQQSFKDVYEPQREIRYPKLEPLTQRLRGITDREPPGESVESCLVSLVEQLEATAFRVDFRYFMGENYDNHPDMRNLSLLKNDLEKVAEALEKALATRNAFFRW